MSITASSSPDVDVAFDVAVAVRRGGRSRRAVRFAADNLIPHARRVTLVHVIPSVSSIPSPSGSRIPIEELEREVVDLYVQDLKLKAEQEVIFPFRRLCRSKNVESLVLDGESTEASLLRFMSESGTSNLVLGTSSLGWIRRILKGSNVPTTILKSAPDFCNIFVVTRHGVKVRFANQSIIEGAGINLQMQKVSLKAFTKKEWSNIFNTRTSFLGSAGHEMLQSSVPSDANSSTQVCEDDNASTRSVGISDSAFLLPYCSHKKESNAGKKILELHTMKTYDNLDSYEEVPSIIMNSSTEQGEPPREVARLRKELKSTLLMYRRACEALVHAKKKVAVLSTEYAEEAKQVRDALEREELLKKIAAEEKAKHLEAVKQAEEARQLLAKETLDRHRAESVASRMSCEKFRVVDSLFANGKNCRKYSKYEIEIATDNFSEANKIGEGGYGIVYKCNLDHIPVAVKVLRQDACEKKEEFIREVEVLSQLRHPHMLLLLGGCPEIGCLVYEYMENGSLDDILYCKERTRPLPWFVRFRILFEVACGLSFLHGTKPEPIVHRDLKPGNILLDKNYVSKIGDVGLAKLISDVVPDSFTEYRDTVLAGTLYYMDPEYQRTGIVRPKSDLYALGIIALQLLTARHPRGLLMDVENAVGSGSLANLLDKSISDWPLVEAEKLAKLALKCLRLRCRDRPDLDSEVLPELEELSKMSNVCLKLRQRNVYAPNHYLCPILQEIMDDPYTAADGYTYEHRAIKAWLGKHKISPVTKLNLQHTCIIPNHSLRSAIQEWKSSTALTPTS